MVFCVLLYQALITAVFSDNRWFVAPMIVLMLFTWYYFWVRCRYLRQLSETLPLQLMREAERRRRCHTHRRTNTTTTTTTPLAADQCLATGNLGSPPAAHLPRTSSWVITTLRGMFIHPLQALVRSASFSVVWLQGDPAGPLWAHMDDYAFPERVSPMAPYPAGRTAGDPTRAKEQPGSLFEIATSTVRRMPRALRAVASEFFLDFGIPPAHLDSSVSGYPQVTTAADSPLASRDMPRQRQRALPLETSGASEQQQLLDLTEFCLAPAPEPPEPAALTGVRIHSAATVMPAVDPQTHRPTAMQYQQHSSELPHGFRMNRKHTDFAQPSQSFVDGILDSTPFSYVHPGIYGDLPSLWLPVAHLKRRTERKRSAKQRLADARRALTGVLQDNIIGTDKLHPPHHHHRGRRRDSVASGPPPLAMIAFADDDPAAPAPEDEDVDHADVVRLVEEIHVAAECGRLGIDPMDIALWDPNRLHRCLSHVATTNHVPPSIATSDDPTTISSDSNDYEHSGGIMSDSESDNNDSDSHDSKRIV
ncbi:hypothetical protein IWW38_004884 [Coemansia aciculifera]|uniref:Uncharacterized protein n=1 Tax=Coemansia aciculifera TaxID=417176 RepID=A0ACC1LY58_9FUNG|nr:hypothetical protein IWW38_004884 [Coemansia aciculifera]